MTIDPRASLAQQRLWPDILASLTASDQQIERLTNRLTEHWPRLFNYLYDLYGQEHDFYFHLQQVLKGIAHSWQQQPDYVKDRNGDDPNWYLNRETVGATTYVDRYGKSLKGLSKRLPELSDLGINYLHLMPFFDVPDSEHDGGYAVRDYRKIRSDLGNRADMESLVKNARKQGIRLVLDFVFNHTSDQHRWALAALNGDRHYQDFYFFFSEQQKAQYQDQLRDIFPDKRKGCFTFNDQLDRWIWTTFNSFQWDLNYQNPEVFTAMAQEMMTLVEMGADVVRLDALAFTWKEPGTMCESLPKVHTLIRAFNAFSAIVAPGVVIKSEAIVAPDDVVSYINQDECHLSYNPMAMASMWEALATRETKLLGFGTGHRTQLPERTSWVNYLRCHDDIGWAFDDGDAGAMHINGYGHRQFLNRFYTGKFNGSFANGVPFGENQRTGDCRIAGTFASLCGLEQALVNQDESAIHLAQHRIQMLNSVMFALPGIPLVYLGDERAALNDYSYLQVPEHAGDSRWVHRPDLTTPQFMNEQHKQVGQSIHQHLQRLAKLRGMIDALDGDFHVMENAHRHAYLFVRRLWDSFIFLAANFSEHRFDLQTDQPRQHCVPTVVYDVLAQEAVSSGHFDLQPYQCRWMVAEGESIRFKNV